MHDAQSPKPILVLNNSLPPSKSTFTLNFHWLTSTTPPAEQALASSLWEAFAEISSYSTLVFFLCVPICLSLSEHWSCYLPSLDKSSLEGNNQVYYLCIHSSRKVHDVEQGPNKGLLNELSTPVNIPSSKTQTLQSILFLRPFYQGVFGPEVFVMCMLIWNMRWYWLVCIFIFQAVTLCHALVIAA